MPSSNRSYMDDSHEKGQQMVDIKLFVCCHQPMPIPKHSLLVPVQVGAALTDKLFPGFLYDNTGENISQKNRSYCELTAQYWAWKNIEADYYGFFHYRRYLYPNLSAKRPYHIAKEPSLSLLEGLGYDGFSELIQGYDLIAPMAEDMHISVREHYADSQGHHKKDLELAVQLVRERCPEMEAAINTYLTGTTSYFGNIYIMQREVFRDYCAWLFPILEEFDQRADTSNYTSQEKRVDGYIAERLFGIYLTDRRDRLRVLELPRVQFCSDREYAHRKLLNTVLPPGSWRRSLIKKIKRKYENGE